MADGEVPLDELGELSETERWRLAGWPGGVSSPTNWRKTRSKIEAGMDDQEVLLRITIREPPAGVRFKVQRGRNELLDPRRTSAREIVFELPIRVRNDRPDGSPNFLGPFAQGPVGGRFVYVNSGTMAGETVSRWTRRAKIPLAGITWPMIANAAIGGFIEAGIAGTARDGGPACATVPLLEKGWKVSKS